MTKSELHEKRKFRRFPLSKKDAVYCVVVKARSADRTIALSTVDFGQSGFQFAIIPTMKSDFSKGEKLFLKAITGTRNLTFAKPIELSIRWQHHDIKRDIVNIGCEICTIASESERQFIDFVKSEVKFKGIRVGDQIRERRNYSHLIQDNDQRSLSGEKESMRIVSILGSPFEDGNTAKILVWVEKELESVGHHVERFGLYSKDVNGCLGCLQCKENQSEPGCVQIDDVSNIINSMLNCDLVIYASPVYYTGFSSQMKAFIDRCHCLFRGSCSDPNHTSFIEGQRHALIVTAADPFVDCSDQIQKTFDKMLDCYKACSAGEFFVCNCKDHDAIDEEIRLQAKKFFEHLFDEMKTPYAVFIPG
ncbi:MAG: flavodoxin family protein [Deltaproteobacteria bacterium]|nr:flavodoxin family protein [Deltaproteobacteria bacterium]